MMKKSLSWILALLLLLSLLGGCAKNQPAAQDGITVVDCVGRTVTVPADPQSICDLCPFSGPMLVMFGCGERVTTSCNNAVRSRLLSEICPSMENAVVVKNSGAINAEEILAKNTDLILTNKGVYDAAAEREKLDAMGIPYVVIDFETIDEQFAAVRVLGETLQQSEKAEQYISWFRSVLDRADAAAAGAPAPARLYHSVNEAVRTDYKGSYCAEWIAHTGAVNVALESGTLNMEGGKAYTTLEQIYAWDPEIIICNEAQVDDYILSDEKWVGLSAVQSGRVYQIPIGITRWGHPTSFETPLALLWLMRLLYPDTFDVDLDAEIRAFYQTFFDYTLSDDWLAAIKDGSEMRTPKTEQKGE